MTRSAVAFPASTIASRGLATFSTPYDNWLGFTRCLHLEPTAPIMATSGLASKTGVNL